MRCECQWRGDAEIVKRCARAIAGMMVVIAASVVVGCEMDKSANRFEQLNIETKKLVDILRQITDEASAKEHEAELTELADEIREIQKGIVDGLGKSKNKGGAMIVNHRQASLYAQVAQNASNRIRQIRETDEKAADIVDKAVAGLVWE